MAQAGRADILHGMSEILMLLGVIVGALYWLNSMRCKEIASNAAKRECSRAGLQFLDQTVHQQRLSMSRDPEGTWRLWRDYRFDYSPDGLERERGRILLLGHRVIAVNIQAVNTIVH